MDPGPQEITAPRPNGTCPKDRARHPHRVVGELSKETTLAQIIDLLRVPVFALLANRKATHEIKHLR
jgi:hypothetical protein